MFVGVGQHFELICKAAAFFMVAVDVIETSTHTRKEPRNTTQRLVLVERVGDDLEIQQR